MDWQSDNGEIVAKWEKQATPIIWLSRHRRRKRQKCSREWPVKPKTGSGKASVTFSTETQQILTAGNSTDRWKAVLQPPPWPHRCQRSSAEEKQGKGFNTSSMLHPAERSEQCEWKESSLECAGQNPGRSWVEWQLDHTTWVHWSTFWTEQGYSSWSWQDHIYPDLKNLSEDDKSKLFTLYEESFVTGQVPNDWSYSYLQPIPKLANDHSKVIGYHTLTMQNAMWKLMEQKVAGKLAQDLERRNILPLNQGGYRAGKAA